MNCLQATYIKGSIQTTVYKLWKTVWQSQNGRNTVTTQAFMSGIRALSNEVDGVCPHHCSRIQPEGSICEVEPEPSLDLLVLDLKLLVSRIVSHAHLLLIKLCSLINVRHWKPKD